MTDRQDPHEPQSPQKAQPIDYLSPLPPRETSRKVVAWVAVAVFGLFLILRVPYIVHVFVPHYHDARLAQAHSQLSDLAQSLDWFENDVGRYPTTAEGLSALVGPPPNVATWKGPYLKGLLPTDPWGHPYVYRSPGTANPRGYDLGSDGPDGKSGTADDIKNWP